MMPFAKKYEFIQEKRTMIPKRLTNLQKQRRREQTRRESRRRAMKKYAPLCVSRGFIAYAYRKEWDDETVDAAALMMHLWFLSRRKNVNDWVHFPYQKLKGTFGKKYVCILNGLIESGFLERNEKYNYVPGHHCRQFRICKELCDDKITASYRLKTKALQERFIANKEYWKRISAAKRRELLIAGIEAAFTSNDSHAENRRPPCELVGEQMETFKRLIANAFSLKVEIDDDEFMAIVEKRYAEKNTDKYDFGAYGQRIRDKLERMNDPTGFSIDRYGRIHVPITNILREFWDYVFLGERQLSAVDVKSSHVYCLLVLLKDIAINYFGGHGTHEERLANCQFARQIKMIPGLKAHLQRSIIIYQACDFFKLAPKISNESIKHREIMYKKFKKFTNSYIDLIRKIQKNFRLEIQNIPNNFIHYLNSKLCKDVFQVSTDKYIHDLSSKHCKDTGNTSTSKPLQLQITPTIIDTITQTNTISRTVNHRPHPIYVDRDFVGVHANNALYEGATAILFECRCSLKPVDESNKPDSDIDAIPPIRNLFFPCPEELAAFEEMLQGDFYTRLMEEIGMDRRNRDKFKRWFFRFLYRPAFRRKIKTWMEDGTTEKIVDPVRKAMVSLLPSIVFFLDLCKCRPGTLDPRWAYYKWAARAIMYVESQIMVETCTNLWKKYPNMFLVTVHDCIKCLPEDVEKVEAELKRTFEKYHVSPKFEVKHHKRPNNLHGGDCNYL